MFGRTQVCAKGPLQVCAAVGQVCEVPLQVCDSGLLHAGWTMPLHAGATAPLHAPAVPVHSGETKPVQVPLTISKARGG